MGNGSYWKKGVRWGAFGTENLHYLTKAISILSELLSKFHMKHVEWDRIFTEIVVHYM